MKKLSKFWDSLLYTKRMFVLMWRNDKAYLAFVLLDIIVFSCMPFISMYLVKMSISMMEAKADFPFYVAVIVGLLLAGVLGNFIHNWLNYKRDVHGSMINIILYKNIFEKTLNIDYEQLLNKDIKEKRELAIQIIDKSRFATLTNNFYGIVSNIIILLGIVIILAQVDFWVLMVVLVVVIINTLSIMYRQKYNRSVHIDINPILRKLQYFMRIGEDASYVKEIKTYSMDKKMVKQYVDLQNQMRVGVDKTRKLSLFGYGISHAMDAILNGIVYINLGFRVLRGSLSISNFSFFLSSILNFNRSIQSIVSSFVEISNNGQYLQDYFEFMDIKTNMDRKGLAIAQTTEKKTYAFTFDNVSYRYPQKDDYALKNINLELKPDEKLAIVGENGSGKSTLIMLLMRIIDPTQGRILLNGVDIRDYDLEEYKKLFSTVFQDYKLFSFTIKENITALSEEDSARLTNVIAEVGLDQKLASLRKGVDTYLDKLYDNEGVLLSGGESQRLSIARALYKNAPIFILDEPTAALDPRIEHEIYTQFKTMAEGKTTFYITHRLASVRFCDRVIVLREGQVVEMGSHYDLIKANGYYAELYHMQAQYFTESERD